MAVWETIMAGQLSWDSLEELQRRTFAKVRENPELAAGIVSEPSPTYSGGRSAKANDLLWTEAERTARGIQVARVSRGGKWTFHGPGQIVLYPVLSLTHWGFHRRDIVRFLTVLHSGLQTFLQAYGIEAEAATRSPSRPFGLYVGSRKLASFGIAVQNGIVSHGVALYLKKSDHWMAGINPCGQSASELTSLEELGIDIDWQVAALQMVDSVKKGFQAHKNCYPSTNHFIRRNP